MRPFGIDVSSGVESAPGVKDHERLRGALRALAVERASGTHDEQRSRRRDPDARGYFGEFGGRFVPETLVEPVEELERAYLAARDDRGVSRPSSIGC